MKRRLLFITFVLFALFVFAALIIVRPTLWTNQLLSFFNNQLEDRYNIEISAERLTGNILNQLSGDNVVVTTMSDSVLFTAHSLTIQYAPWKVVIGEFAIDEIHIDKPVIYYNEGLELLTKQITSIEYPQSNDLEATPRGQFTIETLRINEGRFVYGSAQNQLNVSKITGEMRIDQGERALTITGDFSSIEAIRPEQQLRSIKFLIHQYPDSLRINNIEFMYDSAFVLLEGKVNITPETMVNLNFQTSQLSLGTILPRYGVTYFEDDQWDIKGNIKTDFQEYQLYTSFTGVLDEKTRASGSLELSAGEQFIDIPSGNITLGSSNVTFNGHYTMNQGGNANVGFQSVNLHDFFETLPVTALDGNMTLVDSSGKLSNPDLTASIDLQPSRIDDYTVTNVLGNLSFRDDTLSVHDSLFVEFATADWYLNGWYSLGGALELDLQFATARFDYLSTALDFPKIYGEAYGDVSLSGTIDSTALDSRIRLRNFGFREFHFDTVAAYTSLANVQTLREGRLFVEARNGEAWGKNVAFGNLAAETVGDSVIVQNLRLSDQDDHLYVSGGISKDMRGKLSKVELQYKNTFIHNRTPLPFQIHENGLNISQGVLGVNNGLVTFSGTVKGADTLRTQVDFTNIDLGPLNRLLQKPIPFTGVFNGTTTFISKGKHKNIFTDVELTNVIWRDLHYSDVRAQLEYLNKAISITNGEIRSQEGGAMTFEGTIPFDLESLLEADSLRLQPMLQISGDIRLDGIFLENYIRFIPIKQKMAGEVSGVVTVGGVLADPEATFDLEIHQPRFDAIEGYHLASTGSYEDNRLTFDDIQLQETAESGHYAGEGHLPLEIDLLKPVFRLHRDKQMQLDFHAETPRLQFLSKYMSDVDAVTGDFTLDLRVSGTPDSPRRDGQVTIKDANIEVKSLENEINGVNGRGILRNDTMEVRDFRAKMRSPGDREIIEGAFNRLKHWVSSLFNREVPDRGPNLRLSGSLDFARFFNPELNLQLDGENLYIRTLLGEIEGVADASISVTGRDSLLMVGELQPEEVILRMDFAKDDTPREITQGGGGRFVEYNLHTTFPGNFYIRNAQVNAEFEGDIWIVRHGAEPLNFSGSMNVIRGKYYYYNDTFTIQEGQIIFDPVEFNPRLNIVATTEIEDQVEVTIKLSGELDNPKISLETSDEGGGYSESEILEILTFSQELEQGLAAPDIQPIFTAYLEKQLEQYGSQLMGLETFELETEGQSIQNLENVTITVGRRVAPNLYFTYGRGFLAENPTNTLGLEYQLNRYMSFVGEVDEEGLYHFKYRLKYNY